MKTRNYLILIFLFTASINLFAQQKLGLALSGGGAKGLMHIGVLKVLEENNIYPDYITGTSMGCLIGAMYAMGYSASEIEKLIKEMNWNELFNESISRLNLSLNEKDYNSRFLTSFPILNRRIKLPSGLIYGTKIWNLFAKLTWNKNFENLNIPLRCIATDIETGKAVVLKSGNLADAMRASMSIPSIFVPVEVDGKLLVDGGLIRNLPVSDLKEMGADYIIAVNVNAPLYSKDQLDSFIKIMDQTTSFMNYENTLVQEKIADLVIKPNIKDLDMFSFRDTDILIKRGEEATRLALDNIKIHGSSKPKINKPENTKILIKNIKFEGLTKVSKKLLLGIIDLKTPKKYSHDDIAKVLVKLNGTPFFNTTSFLIEDETLIIRVNEKSENFINFGLHYDTYENISILLNTSIRNIIIHGSKFNVDAVISKNPSLRAVYYTPFFVKSSFAFKNEFFIAKYDTFTYDEDKLIGDYRYGLSYFKTSLETVFSNDYIFSVGVQKEFTTLNSIITINDDLDNYYNEYLNFSFSFNYDTIDKPAFPNNGTLYKINLEYLTDGLALQNNIEHPNFTKLFIQNSNYLSISKKSVLNFSGFFGHIVTGTATVDKLFYMGGHRTQNPLVLPFNGLSFMQDSGSSVFSLSAGIRYEAISDFFISSTFDFGKSENNFNDLFNGKDNLFGSSISFAYYTGLIGPIELSFMKELNKKSYTTFLSVGYWF